MGWFKGGLKGKGRVSSVITDISYNYMQGFLKYKYSVKHVCTH